MHGPLNVKDGSTLRKPWAIATSCTTNTALGDGRLKPALRSDRLATIHHVSYYDVFACFVASLWPTTITFLCNIIRLRDMSFLQQYCWRLQSPGMLGSMDL